MAARISQLVVQVLRSQSVGISVSAATTITLTNTPTADAPIHDVSAVSGIIMGYSTFSGGDFEVSCHSGLIVSANGFPYNSSKYVSASNEFLFATTVLNSKTYSVAASTNLIVTPTIAESIATGSQIHNLSASSVVSFSGDYASLVANLVYSLSASNALYFSGDYASLITNRVYSVSAVTVVTMTETPSQSPAAKWPVSPASGFLVGSSASVNGGIGVSASTAITFGSSVYSGREISVSCMTAINMASQQGSNNFLSASATSGFVFRFMASAVASATEVSSSFSFSCRASAAVILPIGGGTPGGCQDGVRTVLSAGISGQFPCSFAETASGLILVANGIDPMMRWDGLSGVADTAGVLPPTTAIELGGTGLGCITGWRVAYVRFIDQYGNYSNLSPVSNGVEFGHDGFISGISSSSSKTVILSYAHGLTTGDAILISGVIGLPVSGAYTVTVADCDNFSLNGMGAQSGTWKGGGQWVMGIETVVYGAVPVPTESKVVRRQILRNLDGNAEVFYVDIDTTDLASTAFSSTQADEVLASGLPVPLFTANETPQANRYGVPPSYKAVVASHLGRIFAAGDVACTAGNCQPLFGLNQIIGVATDWQSSMVGRLIYMTGASASYEIASVDEAHQVIYTTSAVVDALGPFTSYAIRPAPGERKFVYYTEPALPEAWPAWNAISLPEDSDDITAMFVKGSFLYILEQRHAYKFTFQSDPARDGFVFLTTQRGCINNRCYVQVEDTVYLLDEIGIYAFDGQSSEPVSTPIQTIFQQLEETGLQVNWQADQTFWHAAHDPVRDTIRWFVAMSGMDYPRHAIAYDYRRKRFWIEEYPFTVTSSTVGTLGYRRSIAGSEARRVLCLGEGSLDTVDSGNGFRGSVASAGPLSLTDTSAAFPANLAGAPVSIAQGKGYGQQRKITTNTSTSLNIDRPWLVSPDTTSVYQVGGINWSWRSGWFRFADEQEDNSRDVELIFQPLRSESSVSMRMYFDHDDRPRTWARSIEQDGVTINYGQPEITVDLRTRSGFAVMPLTGHRDPTAPGDRYISVEVTGVQARDLQRVYSVSLNGVRQQ